MLIDCPLCGLPVRVIPDFATDPPTIRVGRHLRKKARKRFAACEGSGMVMNVEGEKTIKALKKEKA